ncbi:MAG TPA: ribosome maturation factor RimM [Roseiflexaceae bacterium]|jgi:16S rRNA processing protein RimM|nr:ribosome maturation factor RimM [Roseiflexaceae bacterium]
MTTPIPDDFLLIGEIVAPFGTHGQVKVRSYTDHVEHLQRRIRAVYLGPEWQQVPLKHVLEHKPGLLVLTLGGVTTREQADDLRGTEVAIREQEAAPLDEGEYFIHQLYGLTVVNEAGETLGKVREVMETGANDVLVVQRDGQPDVLIPMIHDVVQELDIANHRVVIRPLEGLL